MMQLDKNSRDIEILLDLETVKNIKVIKAFQMHEQAGDF